MEIGIFDLETSGFYADSSILLCCSVKGYKEDKVKTIRADQFNSWRKNKSHEKEMIEKIAYELDKYDILIAHNGQWFDKSYFNAKCMQYNIRPVLRFKKLIDPVQISRRHLRLGRNSLAAIIDYLEIPVKKTPIELHKWVKASHDGDIKSMNTICEHCAYDVITLEKVYSRLRLLIDKIDTRGSAF
ncbi:MAG: ribonuclease H-like domain-containing protein [Thermoplasmata archaeon]